MAVGNLGVFVGPDLDLSDQLRWAVRLAEARNLDIVVFQRIEGSERQTVNVPLDGSAEGEAAVAAGEVFQAIESMPILRAGPRPETAEDEALDDDDSVIHVQLKLIRCANLPSLRELLLAEVRKSKLKLFTVVRKDLGGTGSEITRERRQFLRHVPCEVVHCSGFNEDNDLSRILVTVASGPHAASALKIGRDLASSSGATLTALRVNPSIGPDAEQVGARRLDILIKKSLGKDEGEVLRRVVVDDQIPRGVRRVWDEGNFDLVITGASRVGMLGSRVEGSIGARLARDESGPTVAVVSSASPVRNRFLAVLEGAIERLVPQIDREDRVVLVERVQSSSHSNFDFFALMVLSTCIAAIGLIQNSAAVVIGAMLVAPLMTPLLGLGLALVQGNPVLARISVRSVGFGVVVALLVGLTVGFLTPGFEEPTREMLGRGGPSVLDLFVAFASGLAAAYASSRPGLLAALPGVAIAAALVPPIATSGLALSLGNLDLAFNALLLFVINMVTIVLATVVSLWFVGLRNIKKTSRWAVRVGGAVLLAVLALGVYLSIKPTPIPTAAGLPTDFMEDIQRRLGDDYRLEGIGVAYDELGVQLNVRVVGKTFAPENVANEVRAAAREHFDKPVRVRMLTQVDAEAEAFGSQLD